MEKQKQEVQRPEGIQIQAVNAAGQVIQYPVIFEKPDAAQALTSDAPDVTPENVQARQDAAAALQQQAVHDADVAREKALGLTPSEPEPVDPDAEGKAKNSRRA